MTTSAGLRWLRSLQTRSNEVPAPVGPPERVPLVAWTTAPLVTTTHIDGIVHTEVRHV